MISVSVLMFTLSRFQMTDFSSYMMITERSVLYLCYRNSCTRSTPEPIYVQGYRTQPTAEPTSLYIFRDFGGGGEKLEKHFTHNLSDVLKMILHKEIRHNSSLKKH